ncbi:MAG: rhamnan synthesis F family protein [Gallionella sp.]
MTTVDILNKFDQSKYRVLIMAHYHSKGLVRTDTLQLLNEARHHFHRVIFVSTNLNQAMKLNMPEHVEVIERDNIGYDFYSYRYGLTMLRENIKAWHQVDEVCLLNSSFLCFDAQKFYENFLGKINGDHDAFGLVKSYETAEHLQSYALLFKSGVLKNQRFLDWWDSMQPINERQKVIENYEIGLSGLIMGLGMELNAAFNHFDVEPNVELDEEEQKNKSSMFGYINNNCNPSHFHWKNLLDNYSMIKIEVIKSNPFKMNLKYFVDYVNKDKRYGDITLEGMSN